MKKLLVSLTIIAAVSAIIVGATTSFFTDTETSTGNTFTAGAIDLGIDNESYYNGVANVGTSWMNTYDLDDTHGPANGKYLYFNFDDLKPGDWGEDTISLHVNNNDAWVCANITLTSDLENGITEPEMDLDDTDLKGELADAVNFIWWADDGDNVLEVGETVISPNGALGSLGVNGTYTVTIADSTKNIFNQAGAPGPLTGATDYYIGKAWCFGVMGVTDVQQDGHGKIGTNGPTSGRGAGVTCNGADVTNISQSDSMTADIGFIAEQSRNNEGFKCVE
ncbi:MAG: SipW-dependent-type signal peptide-containing protein [bacterium]